MRTDWDAVVVGCPLDPLQGAFDRCRVVEVARNEFDPRERGESRRLRTDHRADRNFAWRHAIEQQEGLWGIGGMTDYLTL